jgi:hypothetical protein
MDPIRWSYGMDEILVNYIQKLADDDTNEDALWAVTSNTGAYVHIYLFNCTDTFLIGCHFSFCSPFVIILFK